MALAVSVNQGRVLAQSTAYTRSFYMGVTGLTLTLTISKAGAAFGAAAGAVSEITSGWYKVALTTVDTGTLGDLAYHATDGGVNIEDWSDQVAILPAVLADGVAHGGTLGSSTATLAFSRVVGQSQTSNTAAFSLTGNGTGVGLLASGGATGMGAKFVGGSTSGHGLYCTAIDGYGATFEGAGSNAGAKFQGGTTGDGVDIIAGLGASSSASGLYIQGGGNGTNAGNAVFLYTSKGTALEIEPTTGHGINIVADGAGKHDINLAGSGDLNAALAANITKVNSITISGLGTTASPWGPA